MKPFCDDALYHYYQRLGGYRLFPGETMFPTATPTCCFNEYSLAGIFVLATLFLVIYRLPLLLVCTKAKASLMGTPFINTLINYCALLVGNLVGAIVLFIIRTLRNPPHLRGYYQQLKLQD